MREFCIIASDGTPMVEVVAAVSPVVMPALAVDPVALLARPLISPETKKLMYGSKRGRIR